MTPPHPNSAVWRQICPVLNSASVRPKFRRHAAGGLFPGSICGQLCTQADQKAADDQPGSAKLGRVSGSSLAPTSSLTGYFARVKGLELLMGQFFELHGGTASPCPDPSFERHVVVDMPVFVF